MSHRLIFTNNTQLNNTNYISGSGVGAVSASNRRALKRRSNVNATTGKRCCDKATNPCSSLLLAGNANANMDETGLTNLIVLNDEDDEWGNFPVNFDFYFFGTNYGNGENLGIFWDTNSVLGFGPGDSDNPWSQDTGLGILIGNEDRLNNSFWYSNTLTTSSGANYVRLLYFGQNNWNDALPNVLQYEINIIRDNCFQYVEIRTAGIGADIGLWNITDGISFQNTCGDFEATGPVVGGSYVFRSDLTGNNWEFFRNYHIDK